MILASGLKIPHSSYIAVAMKLKFNISEAYMHAYAEVATKSDPTIFVEHGANAAIAQKDYFQRCSYVVNQNSIK